MVGGACYRLGEGAGLEKCLRKKTRNSHQFLQGPVTFRDKERKESYNGEDFPGSLSQKIFQNSVRLKENPDWGGGRYFFSRKLFRVVMIMLYFRNLKPASTSFFPPHIQWVTMFLPQEQNLLLQRSAVTFQLPLYVCGICPRAVPPSLASDPGDLLCEALFSLTPCPTPSTPAVRSFWCPSLHELLFSLLLLINTH